MHLRGKVIPGVPPHKAMYIADNMRELDRKECGYMHHDPQNAIFESVYMSDMDMIWLIEVERIPAGCFGCGMGIPWLLGTDNMSRIKIQFMKESREYVDRMKDRYSVLCNWVWEKNIPSVKWLEWLGFKPIGREEVSEDVFFLGYELR
jgi:hypothetical protein